jgi:hypothetical protein
MVTAPDGAGWNRSGEVADVRPAALMAGWSEAGWSGERRDQPGGRAGGRSPEMVAG